MTSPAHRVALRVHRAVAGPFFGRRRLVLIVGLMRSGSSLLSNVLTSNPEVCGVGEAHVDYRDADGVLDLAYWLARFTHHYPRRSQWMLDKVLHKRHLDDPRILLERADLRVIFLLRDPDTNARSLRELFERNPEPTLAVEDYMRSRYRQLTQFVERLPAAVPSVLLTYDQLVGGPVDTLAAISDFLDLATPLSPEYDVPAWVGRQGIGDYSPHIRTGRVRGDIERAPASVVPTAPAVRAEWTRLHELVAARSVSVSASADSDPTGAP